MVTQNQLKAKLNLQIAKAQKLVKEAQKLLDESLKVQKEIDSLQPPSHHVEKLIIYDRSKKNLQDKIQKQKDPVKKDNLKKVHKAMTKDIAITFHDYLRSKKSLPPDTRYHKFVRSNKI